VQFAVGTAIALFMWITGILKRPKISGAQVNIKFLWPNIQYTHSASKTCAVCMLSAMKLHMHVCWHEGVVEKPVMYVVCAMGCANNAFVSLLTFVVQTCSLPCET